MAEHPSSKSGEEDVWTVGRLLTWTTEWLGKQNSESPRLDAEVLLASVRKCPRILLYTAFDEIVDGECRQKFRDLVRRRGQGEPVAYLVGSKEFFSISLDVTPDTLIPRPETEGLIIRALDVWKEEFAGKSGMRVLDVGTGSGAIAIALASHMKDAVVTATDISSAALTVALRNAKKHSVDEQIQFVQADVLEHQGQRIELSFEYIWRIAEYHVPRPSEILMFEDIGLHKLNLLIHRMFLCIAQRNGKSRTRYVRCCNNSVFHVRSKCDRNCSRPRPNIKNSHARFARKHFLPHIECSNNETLGLGSWYERVWCYIE